MIGTTNSSQTPTGIYTCTDPHTILLLNDIDVVDHSQYHIGLFYSGQVPYPDYKIMRDGRPSIHFDGSHYLGICKSDLINSDHPWTIELWWYGLSSRSSALTWIVVSGQYYGLLWGYDNNARVTYLSNNGSSWNLIGGTQSTDKGTIYNTWQHRALVWTGSHLLNFTDGKLILDSNLTGYSWTFGGNYCIGNYAGTYIIGCMQDYRLSDIARYTTDFTPPQRFV